MGLADAISTFIKDGAVAIQGPGNMYGGVTAGRCRGQMTDGAGGYSGEDREQALGVRIEVL